MLIDKDIQLSGTLTPFQGPDINNPPPINFSFTVAGGVVETDIYGPQNCGALVQIKKSINVVTQPVMNFTLVRNIFPFGSFTQKAQADEGDLRITIDGITYPFDNQIANGVYQVGDLNGNWHPTAIKVPPPPAYQWTQYRIACILDQTAKVATQTSLSINGAAAMAIPASFAQPADNIGWEDCIIGQAQCCIGVAGQMGYAWKWNIEWD